MSGTITYEYSPGDKVWVIYDQASQTVTKSTRSRTGYPPRIDGSGVKEGTIVYFRTDVLRTEVDMWYGVNLKGTDTTRDFDTADVFGSLAEALVEYEYRLTGDVNACMPIGVKKVVQYNYTAPSAMSTHTIVHNLGLPNVTVVVYDTQGLQILPIDVEIIDDNNVQVRFTGQPVKCTAVVLGETCAEIWTNQGADHTSGARHNPCT